MKMRSISLVAIAMALAYANEMPMVDRQPIELPPHDPNFRIKKPVKSWGRKSKKRCKR